MQRLYMIPPLTNFIQTSHPNLSPSGPFFHDGARRSGDFVLIPHHGRLSETNEDENTPHYMSIPGGLRKVTRQEEINGETRQNVDRTITCFAKRFDARCIQNCRVVRGAHDGGEDTKL